MAFEFNNDAVEASARLVNDDQLPNYFAITERIRSNNEFAKVTEVRGRTMSGFAAIVAVGL